MVHMQPYFDFVCRKSGKQALESRKSLSTLFEWYKSEKLIYRKCTKSDLRGFLHCDWAGNLDSRKITAGYCFKRDNSSGATSRAIKFQKCVTTSSAEVELNAVVEASKEVAHLANLLKEMNIDIEQPL